MNKPKPSILILDDEPEWRERFKQLLHDKFKNKYDLLDTGDYHDAKAIISNQKCVLAVTNVLLNSNISQEQNITNWRAFIKHCKNRGRVPIITATSGEFVGLNALDLADENSAERTIRTVGKKEFHELNYVQKASDFINDFERKPKKLNIEDNESLSLILSKLPSWNDKRTRDTLLSSTKIPEEIIGKFSIDISNNKLCADRVIFEIGDIGTLANEPDYTALGSLVYIIYTKTYSRDKKILLGEIILKYNLIFNESLRQEIDDDLKSLLR